MTNQVIPEAVIEAAHAAICEQNLDDCLDPDWRGKCVKALEAAAPYMMADAWDEGFEGAQGVYPQSNPYRSQV